MSSACRTFLVLRGRVPSLCVKGGNVTCIAWLKDGKFTGNLVVMHIPFSEIPVQYRVNVEVAQDGSVYLAYQGDKIEYVKIE